MSGQGLTRAEVERWAKQARRFDDGYCSDCDRVPEAEGHDGACEQVRIQALAAYLLAAREALASAHRRIAELEQIIRDRAYLTSDYNTGGGSEFGPPSATPGV